MKLGEPALAAAASAEEWVQGVIAPVRPVEPMKRFTIDVLVTLYSARQGGSARRGLKMADMLRELLEREFPKS